MELLRTGFDPDRMKRTFTQNFRIPIYCGLILVCSIITIPEDYKIDKRNILNQWFVKLGWFWTSALTLPFIFANIKMEDRLDVSRATFRFIMSTIFWYMSTNLFQLLDDATGFDISGHTFLLVFSNLLITSEMKLSDTSSTDKRDSLVLPMRVSLLVLTSLWDFMLIQTALYYHTILQKLIAAMWAIGSWYMLHILFYEKDHEFKEDGVHKKGKARG